MGRNILLITTDQQRFDALGCNGGSIARTPTADRLAADGLRYLRPYVQSTICMPSRATILTGQYTRTHGVRASGIPLPADAPSVAATLANAGYRTALIGKAHFEPALQGDQRYEENRLVPEGRTGPYRGFDHAELASHGPVGINHYHQWLLDTHSDAISGFARPFTSTSMGDTGAPEVAYNPIPRDQYHTDWLADRAIAWLDGLSDGDDWFCWLSFPDPHHPWDPPASERHRVAWTDLDLPAGYLDRAEAERVLAQKPAHWLRWYLGEIPNLEGACPPGFVPAKMSTDQLREIEALIHIENELIDEACRRVLVHLERRGWDAETDVLFTSDHGEFQGDYGLLYKGPYHVESLMRVPLIWRPAPSANIEPAVITDPVGLVDLAPTICQIANVDIPDVMEGAPLPVSIADHRERALCEWDSTLDTGYRMRTIVQERWLCTAYAHSRPELGLPSAPLLALFGGEAPEQPVIYQGSEGELYDLEADPFQRRNLWDDPGYISVRSDLVLQLYDSLPPQRQPVLRPEAIA